eukprot:1748311-Rhodomonas_salina.1
MRGTNLPRSFLVDARSGARVWCYARPGTDRAYGATRIESLAKTHLGRLGVLTPSLPTTAAMYSASTEVVLPYYHPFRTGLSDGRVGVQRLSYLHRGVPTALRSLCRVRYYAVSGTDAA